MASVVKENCSADVISTDLGWLLAQTSHGLDERTPSKTDRRARVISVTAKGKKRIAEAEQVTADLYEEVLGELDADQRQVLLGALDKLQSGSLAENSPCQKTPRRRAPR